MHVDGPSWFSDSLACHRCGVGLAGALTCPSCGTGTSLRDGIYRALAADLLPALERQAQGWRLVERARGAVQVTAEQYDALPHEPLTRSLLDWLRAVLRQRGPCRVLELGAGRGWASRALARDGHQVVAVDILDDPDVGLGCAVARRDGDRWFGCVLAQAEALPFLSESFDCVCCFSTLQHIPDYQRVLEQVARVLHPGGIFVAFRDGYRGLLCTPWRCRQGGLGLTVATLDREDAQADRAHGRPARQLCNPAYGPHEICRRVLDSRRLAAESGLAASVLPAMLVSGLGADWLPHVSDAARRSAYLTALAAAYELDGQRLASWIEAAWRSTGVDLLPDLLSYWILMGNLDGVLLARKQRTPLAGDLLASVREPAACRQVEPLLLSCARHGYVPAYGVGAPVEGHDGRTRWLLPEAGLLVPPGDAVEATLTALSPPVLDEMVRLEVRRENEGHPAVVVALLNAQTATLRVPLSPHLTATGAALVHLRVDPPVYARGDGKGTGGDIRIYAGAQLRNIRSNAVAPDQVAQFLACLRAAA